jgi:demethylmenaquinone methyltransferase/2-methoxy-6-polyprenyl-1,4-benzoquinol methylase
MGKDEEEGILRVSVTPEDIKKSYGIISKFYSSLEGRFEKGMREKGLKLLAIKEGEIILEIGVGTGFSLREISRRVGTTGKAYGIDITPEMLRLTEKRLRKAGLMDRVELIEGDARNMPFKDNTFDAVYMAATLELFDTPDIPRVLGEIKRVLKANGRLGVNSLSKEGQNNNRFLKLYEWMHRKFPKYASCRPIYVEKAIKDAGFNVLAKQELMIMKLVPIELVIAKTG